LLRQALPRNSVLFKKQPLTQGHKKSIRVDTCLRLYLLTRCFWKATTPTSANYCSTLKKPVPTRTQAAQLPPLPLPIPRFTPNTTFPHLHRFRVLVWFDRTERKCKIKNMSG
jgi:hypothetical protein